MSDIIDIDITESLEVVATGTSAASGNFLVRKFA